MGRLCKSLITDPLPFFVHFGETVFFFNSVMARLAFSMGRACFVSVPSSLSPPPHTSYFSLNFFFPGVRAAGGGGGGHVCHGK